ncbi:MAG: hypothetical protein WC264_01345 [Candidatus Paceibacterota bacterium]|jgi:FtsH-binding integral membrane protein
MKINKIKYFAFVIVMFSFLYMPSISLAQQQPEQSSSRGVLCSLVSSPKLGDLLGYITCIISKSVIPLIFALAIASFIWGVVQYVINNDDEAKKAKGKMFMIWGIIALTVMVSVWGLVSILGNTFGILNVIPQLK